MSAPASQRIGAIDLTRGVLMIAIICAHATFVVEPGHGWMMQVTRHLLSGTIGFTTISGLLVGWFAVVKRDRYGRVAHRYLVQAGRLLAIAHPLMAIALFLPYRHAFADYGLRTLFITDTLAVLFVVVVPAIPRIAPRVRLGVGIVMLLADAFFDLYTAPNPVLRLLHELACGVDPNAADHVLLSNYGLLPLGGMFLIGTWLGEVYARVEDQAVFAAKAARAAALLALSSCALVGCWMLARHAGHGWLTELLYPDFETTLYPVYLAWTLVLFTQALAAPLDHRIARTLILIGQNTLFVYVAQYYVVETIPALLGGRAALPPIGWVAVCIISLAVLVPATAAWSRWRARVRASQ